MGYAASFRDSTQIEVQSEAIAGLESAILARFKVTLRTDAGCCRIIGAPSEIKRVDRYLFDRGVTVD